MIGMFSTKNLVCIIDIEFVSRNTQKFKLLKQSNNQTIKQSNLQIPKSPNPKSNYTSLLLQEKFY